VRYLLVENPYIWSRFANGDAATITIYDASDDSIVVNAAAMSELATTGYFKYQFNPTPGNLTEYFYITTNGTEEHAGKIILGGYPDDIKDKTDTIDWDNITSLIDEIGGKWEITGNQMIFYKADNATEIMRFNLFDADGNPATTDVYKRERVP
jgi:hypothetical protein